MNTYIELDSYCYKTNAKTWKPPIDVKPMSIRIVLDGSLDVTYGNGTMEVWEGEIVAPIQATGGPVVPKTWGTYANLKASLAKREGLAFVDHSGTAATVHVSCTSWRSFLNKWDAASNKMYASVRIVG